MLASTAESDDSVITVQDDVSDWEVGALVVIATTGGHNSQDETEVRSIDSIENGGTELHLNASLEYKHMGISETHASVSNTIGT